MLNQIDDVVETTQTELESEAAIYEAWYEQLEQKFKITDFHLDSSSLVTSVESSKYPLHNWYTLKESFSPDLPGWIIDYIVQNYGGEIARVLDVFLGGGTTGVALAQRGIDVDGLEYNPFIHLVASTKSHYMELNPDSIKSAIENIQLTASATTMKVPDLSTLSEPTYFRPSDLQIILYATQQVRSLVCDNATRDFLLLGIAAAIDDVANLRKDGRALRFSDKQQRPPATEAIQERWRNMLGDIGKLNYTGEFNVFKGTALDLRRFKKNPLYDMALYSPPYLNNFDYSEIYKLELWLLGCVVSRDAWQQLRKHTLRSHPSIRYAPTKRLRNCPNTKDIAITLKSMETSTCLGSNKVRTQMKGVITGYFDDMYQTLKQQWHLIRPGGYLVYVVANSRHQWLPIATDVIIAEIAQRIGFSPLELLIMKKRNGRTRQKAFLRESVVIMKKPASTTNIFV